MLRTIAVSLFLIATAISSAKAQKVGDWSIDVGYTHLGDQRFAIASTPGDRRNAELVIYHCGKYEVGFLFKPDQQFGEENIPSTGNLSKIAFLRFEGRGGASDGEPVVLSAGEDKWYVALSNRDGAEGGRGPFLPDHRFR